MGSKCCLLIRLIKMFVEDATPRLLLFVVSVCIV